jgi:hypothetical protein
MQRSSDKEIGGCDFGRHESAYGRNGSITSHEISQGEIHTSLTYLATASELTKGTGA